MKIIIRIQLLLLILLLGITVISCEKKTDFFDQPVYFEYMYKNMAWGYQHFGWLIDNNGNINYYNNPDDWRYVGDEGISYPDLIFNLGQTDSVIATIEPEILKEKIELIKYAIDGEITPLQQRAYDAGGSVLVAYYFDDKTKMYKSVFLGQSGDFESHNMDSSAISLTNWLKQFGVFWLD